MYNLIQFESIPYKALNINCIFLIHQNIQKDIHQDTDGQLKIKIIYRIFIFLKKKKKKKMKIFILFFLLQNRIKLYFKDNKYNCKQK
jgi:hypothetical protein